MLKLKEKNVQATRTELEFCFHSSCGYLNTRCRRATNALTTSATRSWAVHRKQWYVTILRCYLRLEQWFMENVSDMRILSILSQVAVKMVVRGITS